MIVDAIKNALGKKPVDTARFREAVGQSIDADEANWRKLTGNENRDLSPITQGRQLQIAAYLWAANPLANRLIELPVAYLLAEGVRLKVDDKDAQEWLDAFWRDPINRMAMKLPKKARELALYGEQCWPVFVNSINGHMRLGYIDPAQIEKVVTDPDNIEQPIGIIARTTRRGLRKRYRVITGGPESVFTENTQAIRRTFTDGDCFFFTINDLSNATRGHSDLLPVMDWLDVYDEFLLGEADRNDSLRSYIWDVVLKGADPDTVRQRAAEITVPTRGGIRVHNDAEEWSAVTPDLQAVNATETARLLRNHILGGVSVPEHWYGGGGDVNRNTASSMDETTAKVMAMRQNIWKHILEMVGQYQVNRRLQALFGEAIDIAEPAWQVRAEFPEMAVRDTSAYAAALQQVVFAVGAAMGQGMLTQDSAVDIIVFIAGRLGVELDAEEELKALRENGFDGAPDMYAGQGVNAYNMAQVPGVAPLPEQPQVAVQPTAVEVAPAPDTATHADTPDQLSGLEEKAQSIGEDAAVPELSLNGAQVTAMLDVVDRVVKGTLPRESAIAALETAFNIPTDKAEKVLGSVGKGFKPAMPEGGAAV